MMAALSVPKSSTSQLTIPKDNLQNGTKFVRKHYHRHTRRTPSLMDPDSHLRLPNEPTLPTIPPVNFAHTQSPSIPIVDPSTTVVPPRRIDDPNTENQSTAQFKPHVQVTIGETTYHVCNPFARLQEVCRKALFFKCPHGRQCHRLHLRELPLPRDHIDIVCNQPELIKVIKTVQPSSSPPPPPASAMDSVFCNDPAQPIVKLPPPHLPSKSTASSIATPSPVSQTLGSGTPAIKLQSASPPSTTCTPKDPPPHLRQASAAVLPSKVSATSGSHQPTRKSRDPPQSQRKDSILTVETFYSQICVDDNSGFWGWKSGDRDAWDDTGQSSSDVSMVSRSVSCILAP
ncbi:hypothetical protein AB1N83_003702, partial [Pleurotus pulmonarius]